MQLQVKLLKYAEKTNSEEGKQQSEYCITYLEPLK